LKKCDYTHPGAYFVTVVARLRIYLFGEVVNGKMKLNAFGEISREEWLRTESLQDSVHLYPDEMVVMPNHIHGIIWIDESDDNPSGGAASLRPYITQDQYHHSVLPNSLGAIIRSYKSAVTYQINTLRNNRGAPVWQRNYYECIVCDQSELENISPYITSNPATWQDDPEYIP
jgi:REP-associated tyrosine transposase